MMGQEGLPSSKVVFEHKLEHRILLQGKLQRRTKMETQSESVGLYHPERHVLCERAGFHWP